MDKKREFAIESRVECKLYRRRRGVEATSLLCDLIVLLNEEWSILLLL